MMPKVWGQRGPKLGVNGAKTGGQLEDVGWGQQDPKFGVNGAKIGGQWGQNWGSAGAMWVGVNKPNNADVAVAALLST